MSPPIMGLIIFVAAWIALSLVAAGLWAYVKQMDKDRDD
jgi:hypothetical protein